MLIPFLYGMHAGLYIFVSVTSLEQQIYNSGW